MKFRVAGFIH